MKIIDEKGRIFGKINVIDFLVLLFLVTTILPTLYFGYKIMTKKPVAEAPKKGESIEIEISCWFIKLKPEVLKLISVGDKELDENGEVTGEIIGLSESKPYIYEFKIGEKEKIVKKDTGLMQLKAKLKLKVEVVNNKPYYKGNEMKVDSQLEFKTHEYTTMAIIPPIVVFEKIEEIIVEERIIDLFVTLKDLDEDTVKLISVGDKELDENGKTVAEIISLGKIESSSLEFDLGGGNSVMGEDNSKKQISARMRLKCQMGGFNQLYFKERRVERNLPIEFKTDKYKINGLVAKTFEITPPIKEKWLSLQVKFSGVLPEIANIVQKGDVEKDAFDKTVARISSVIDNRPSEVLSLRENEFISLSHPFNKDISLFLEVRCIEKEGVYYFKNYPVKMGNNIVFATDLYSISGLIIGMEMK